MKVMRLGWCGCVAALLLIAVAATAAPIAPPPPIQSIPALKIDTLDGKTFNLAAERGKWVIVNLWATWCSPCLAEMPAISKYVAAHRDVTAIGLANQPEAVSVVREFARSHSVDYPLAYVGPIPPPGFAAATLPTTYLIAPDGRVAKHFIGPVNAKLLDAAIAAAKGR